MIIWSDRPNISFLKNSDRPTKFKPYLKDFSPYYKPKFVQYFTNEETRSHLEPSPRAHRVSRSVKTKLNSSCLLLSRRRSRSLLSRGFLRRSCRLFSSSFLRRSLLSCSLRLRRRSLSRLLRLAARFTASRRFLRC